MIDIFSRYIVGVHVHARECGVLATEMMEQIFGTYGIPHVVHADRGTSMTSNSVAGLLAELGVTRRIHGPRSPTTTLQRVLVQDPQVRPDLPGTLRVHPPRTRFHG